MGRGGGPGGLRCKRAAGWFVYREPLKIKKTSTAKIAKPREISNQYFFKQIILLPPV
jgi:hypothetical protein